MEEIFHEIRTAGLKFSREQWSDYCNKKHQDGANTIITSIGKYDFNDHDICINPEVMSIVLDRMYYYVTLSWCDCGNGLWSYGVSYSCGNGGGGFSPAYCTKAGERRSSGFNTENECKLAAVENAVCNLRNCGHNGDRKLERLIAMVEDYGKSIRHPKPVQLELFM